MKGMHFSASWKLVSKHVMEVFYCQMTAARWYHTWQRLVLISFCHTESSAIINTAEEMPGAKELLRS